MSDNLLYTPCSHDNMPDTCVTCLQDALATAGEQLAQMRAALDAVQNIKDRYLRPVLAYNSDEVSWYEMSNSKEAEMQAILDGARSLTATKAERIATARAKVCEAARKLNNVNGPFVVLDKTLDDLRAAEERTQ